MKVKAHQKIKKHLDGMAKHHAQAMKHIAALEKQEKSEKKVPAKRGRKPKAAHNSY